MGKKKSKPSAADDDKRNDEKISEAMTRMSGGTGTFSVARGPSTKEVKQTRKELERKLKTASDKEVVAGSSSTTSTTAVTVDRHLWGNQPDVAKDRLELLKKDDVNPVLDGLNDKQTHALSKRKKKSSGRGKDKILTAKLNHYETKRLEAAVAAADAESILQTTAAGYLEPETDMERTTALTQAQLKRQVDPETARQVFDLDLQDCAPYGMEYDRSGRYSILFGKSRGHLAIMDNQHQTLQTEFYVNERCRDACFLHNATQFAVAQKKHVYIYDNTGTEIHCLGSQHSDPVALQFLPHHWLLASLGRAGWLKYQDTSTGQLVSQHCTSSTGTSNTGGTPPAHLMRQNPANAVIHAGHANGCVTLWSPAQSHYLVKMHCHKGASITSLAVDLAGTKMVTGGADGRIKIWDLRMYNQAQHDYYCGLKAPPPNYANCTVGAGQIHAPTSLDISQRGLLAVGHGSHVTIWPAEALERKVRDPYMYHHVPRAGSIQTVRFRPFEDVCGIGHGKGISSMIVPGCGEPHLDTAEYHVNPAADTKQRRETEVRALLDKLQPEMIVLDPNQVGGMEESNPHVRHERLQDLQEAAAGKAVPVKKQKKKKRGRSKIQTQLRRRQKNIVDQNTAKLRAAREEEKAQAKQERKAAAGRHSDGMTMDDDDHEDGAAAAPPKALERFFS